MSQAGRGHRREHANPRAQGQRPERLPARCRVLRGSADRHRRHRWGRRPARAAVRRTPALFRHARQPARPARRGGRDSVRTRTWLPVRPGRRRASLAHLLNNGSDGPMTAVWPGLGAPALARGYNTLVFDGPGQQSMLFERNAPLPPRLGKHAIFPLVDFLEHGQRWTLALALYGISQAGYWVPRALAFEHRIAAAVADPGVDDVAASWRAHLTPEMLTLLDAGEQEKKIRRLPWPSAESPPTPARAPGHAMARQAVRNPRFRLRPLQSGRAIPARRPRPADPHADDDHRSRRRRTVLGPASHGASTTLCLGARCSCHSPRPEGADMHCEPMARSLLEQRNVHLARLVSRHPWLTCPNNRARLTPDATVSPPVTTRPTSAMTRYPAEVPRQTDSSQPAHDSTPEVRLLGNGHRPSARLVHVGSQPVNVEVRQ